MILNVWTYKVTATLPKSTVLNVWQGTHAAHWATPLSKVILEIEDAIRSDPNSGWKGEHLQFESVEKTGTATFIGDSK